MTAVATDPYGLRGIPVLDADGMIVGYRRDDGTAPNDEVDAVDKEISHVEAALEALDVDKLRARRAELVERKAEEAAELEAVKAQAPVDVQHFRDGYLREHEAAVQATEAFVAQRQAAAWWYAGYSDAFSRAMKLGVEVEPKLSPSALPGGTSADGLRAQLQAALLITDW